jgi:hypothetical protein
MPVKCISFVRNNKVMLKKAKVLKSIRQLPENFSVDELIDRVVLLQKIETGIEQSEKGLVKSTAAAKKSLKKWLK